MQLSDILTNIVALNEEGKIVGKTRLQKTVFLLDQCGLNSGNRYTYHYYGPFSVDIAEAAQDAVELHLLKYEEQFGFHSVPYGTYEVTDHFGKNPATVGDMTSDDVKHKLKVMNKYSAIELELAATIQYLSDSGYQKAKENVTQLKPAKATPERMKKAERLLEELGLK